MYYVMEREHFSGRNERYFTVENIPGRKNPILCVVDNTVHTKVASFDSDESAKLFVEKMKEFLEY